MNQETKMSFLQHFGILRKSFIKIILLIIILFIPAFIFRDLLMDFALMPMSQSLPPDSNIIFTKPAEGLASNIKVAFLSSFIATMPLIIYEAWSFVKPALYENEKIVSLVIIVIGSLLFFVGASFCFFFVAPLAFDVLINEYS